MARLNLNPLSGIKRRLNSIRDGLDSGLNRIHKAVATSHAIDSCVQKEEHKILLYAMLQLGLDVIVDSRDICVQNMDKYLNAVRPASLDNLIRVGGQMDGGYAMLPPPPPQSSSQPKALSLGVSYYSPWDLEMANLGYKVLQYDASIDGSPDIHPNIIFHKKFVGATRNHNTVTFDDIIKEYSFNEKLHNILQMDIENAEWDIFENLDFSVLDKYFSQIILEFHECDPRACLRTKRHVAILEKFLKAWQPIHLHYNPNGSIFYIQERFMASVFEVTYLRKDLLPKNFTLRDTCGDLPNLDYPNLDRQLNIPITFS